jgi:hypothetical protein
MVHPLVVCFDQTSITSGSTIDPIKTIEYLYKSEARMQERTCQEGDTIRVLPGYARLASDTKQQVNEALDRFDMNWTAKGSFAQLPDGSHRLRSINDGLWIERYWRMLDRLLPMLESGDSRFEIDIASYLASPQRDNGKTTAWLYFAAAQLVDLAGAREPKRRIKQAEIALRRLLAHSDVVIGQRVKASEQARKGGKAERKANSNERQSKTAKLALKKQVVEIVRGRDPTLTIIDFMQQWRHGDGYLSSDIEVNCVQCSSASQAMRFRFGQFNTEVEISLTAIQQEVSKKIPMKDV